MLGIKKKKRKRSFNITFLRQDFSEDSASSHQTEERVDYEYYKKTFFFLVEQEKDSLNRGPFSEESHQ